MMAALLWKERFDAERALNDSRVALRFSYNLEGVLQINDLRLPEYSVPVSLESICILSNLNSPSGDLDPRVRAEVGIGKSFPYKKQRREIHSNDDTSLKGRQRREVAYLKRSAPLSQGEWEGLASFLARIMEEVVEQRRATWGNGREPYILGSKMNRPVLFNQGVCFTVDLRDEWLATAVLRSDLLSSVSRLESRAANNVRNFDYRRNNKTESSYEPYRFSSVFEDEWWLIDSIRNKKYRKWVKAKVYGLVQYFQSHPIAPHLIDLYRSFLPEDFRYTFDEIVRKHKLLDIRGLEISRKLLESFEDATLPFQGFRVRIIPWISGAHDRRIIRQRGLSYKNGQSDDPPKLVKREHPLELFYQKGGRDFLRFELIPTKGESSNSV